jgi:beta-phosphoglucomutase
MNITDFSAVIFDMDGLVLDTETTYCLAKMQAAKTMGYDVPEQFWKSLSGLHHNDIQHKLLGLFGLEFNLLEFNLVSESVWLEHVKVNGIKTQHGFFELLDFIVHHSLPYCLATNSNALNAKNCLTFAGIQDCFPLRVTRDDVVRGKPDPDIFMKAAEIMNVDISRCLVLEDSHAGVLAASRAGAYTVFVPSELPAEPTTLTLCNDMRANLELVLESLRP